MAQQAKLVGPGRNRGPRPKVENPGKILKRILAYVMHLYKFPVIGVLCCLYVYLFAQVQGTLFMQTLIDGYITPMLLEKSNDFSGLIGAITRVSVFYCHRHYRHLPAEPYDGPHHPGHAEKSAG